jgi:hypothetical protein
MQLLIRRNQKSGMLGGTKYTLHVRAQLTDEERALVKKNNLAGELLFYFDKDENRTGGFMVRLKAMGGLAGVLARKMRDTSLTVAKIIEGTDITCDNVAELIGVEDQIKEASLMFKAYLDAAAKFGGEEVLDMDQVLAEMRAKA